jgi:hypothetical protein
MFIQYRGNGKLNSKVMAIIIKLQVLVKRNNRGVIRCWAIETIKAAIMLLFIYQHSTVCKAFAHRSSRFSLQIVQETFFQVLQYL